ncbi:hypothetical protein ABZX62_26250 [Streptomyces flavidovirens]|uniref:hypothetical protein n=1 Tax=Streptomyces flavidovirens TaxID=67298 RepID=UPI0033A24197
MTHTSARATCCSPPGNAPASAWALLPDLGAQLRTVITTLPEVAVADLPRGAAEELARFVTRPESLR